MNFIYSSLKKIKSERTQRPQANTTSTKGKLDRLEKSTQLLLQAQEKKQLISSLVVQFNQLPGVFFPQKVEERERI